MHLRENCDDTAELERGLRPRPKHDTRRHMAEVQRASHDGGEQQGDPTGAHPESTHRARGDQRDCCGGRSSEREARQDEEGDVAVLEPSEGGEDVAALREEPSVHVDFLVRAQAEHQEP